MDFSFTHKKPLYQYGVMTGISQNLEFMLPWWWWNYQLHNSYPILFLDFGLSEKGKNWCKERGLLSSLIQGDFVKKKEELDPHLLAEWNTIIPGDVTSGRAEWFKKPMGLLHSPFEYGIWIDLDCEVVASLDHIFRMIEKTKKIAIRRDNKDNSLKENKEHIYNSGVVGFSFQSKEIEQWAKKSYFENDRFMGDQDVLSRVLHENPGSVIELEPEDNMYYRDKLESPRIIHWFGYNGKLDLIRKIVQHPETSFFNSHELMP